MNQDQYWKDKSHGDLLLYAFRPPPQWKSARLAAEQLAMATLLDELDCNAARHESGWLSLAQRLPPALRAVLAGELRHGNQIADIGSSGWPSAGSIVVTVHERFSKARNALPPDVVWSGLNDPHSWREDLSQKVDGIEFLILT